MLSLFPLHPAWNQCAIAFLEHSHSHSKSDATVRNYRAYLLQFFKDVYRTPEQYLRSDVETFLALPTNGVRSSGNPPSISLRNARLSALKSFYNFAALWIVETDGKRQRLLQEPPPTAGIVRSKQGPRHRIVLSQEDIVKLFAVIPTDTVHGLRDRAIYLCYFWTARRRAEVLRLRWGDIERGTVVDASGHSRPGTIYHFRGKGHGDEDDTAELPEPAYNAIMTYLKVAERFATLQIGDPLFVGIGPGKGGKRVDTSKPISGSDVSWNLKRYAALAGLDHEHISLHAFRHASAKAHYLAVPDVRAVGRLLRHKSLHTTTLYLEELFSTADNTAQKMLEQYGDL